MAGVFDVEKDSDGAIKNEIEIGLADWYVIKHQDCFIDCFSVAPSYDLEYCKDVEEASCDGSAEHADTTSLCSNQGAANEEWDGDRYFKVKCESTKCPVHGSEFVERSAKIQVPARYTETYSVNWTEGCHYSHTNVGTCDRENSCQAPKGASFKAKP